MMGRSLVIGSVALAGMLLGTASVAKADHDHHCQPGGYGHRGYGYGGYSQGGNRGGYGFGVGIGYAPRTYYAAPPVVYAPPMYAPPIYAPPPPVYYAPNPYPYGYAPYPASGVGVSTKNFGLWLGR